MRKGGVMNSAKNVDDLVARLKVQVENGGVPLSDAMWETALACVGFPYVFGAWGALCTVKERKYRLSLNPSKTTIQNKCQAWNNNDCSGCKWFPNGERTRCYDCRGFTDWILKQYGFDLEGEGATGQWNSKKNWCKKGIVKDGIPQNVLVNLFIQKNGKMTHTGFYYNGQTIECSDGVQHFEKMKSNRWTQWAVANCFADLMGTPETKPKPAEPVKEQTKVYKTIRKGNKGALVKELQTTLSKLGYDLGICGIDGDFGIATQNAVKEFQRTHKDENGRPLAIDGVVGQKTWTALEKAVSEIGSAPPVVYYTVTITRLTDTESDALLKEYKNATRIVEKG